MSDEAISRVLALLLDAGGPDVILIGRLPAHYLVHWSRRATDDIVITRDRRDHYLTNHPEMETFERDLVRTLLDPDAVFALSDDAYTAAVCARQDARHDVVAIIRISTTRPLQNSVITARRQRQARRGKPSHRNQLVWLKEEK